MGKENKEKKERKIFGVIDEVIIDKDGNEYVPGVTPSYEEPEEKVAAEEKEVAAAEVAEPIEEVAEETSETVEAKEEVAKETKEEKPQEEIVSAGAIALDDEKTKFIAKTFAMKMNEAEEVIQDRYDELKNYALRFKKLKARISRKFDSINKGRLQFVKLSVAGKTLKLYLNMDIDSVDSKFHCKDMRDKKTYVTVPVLLRIKSGRAVKYAKLLIDQCAEFHGLVENKKFEEIDAMALIDEALSAKEDIDDNAEVAVTEE